MSDKLAKIVLGSFDGAVLYCSSCKQEVKTQMFDYGIEDIPHGKPEHFYVRLCECGCVVKSYSWIGFGQRGIPEKEIVLGNVDDKIVRFKIAELNMFSEKEVGESEEEFNTNEDNADSAEGEEFRRRRSKETKKEIPEQTSDGLSVEDDVPVIRKRGRPRKNPVE